MIKNMMFSFNYIKIFLGGGFNFNNIEKIKELIKVSNFYFGIVIRINNSFFEDIDR